MAAMTFELASVHTMFSLAVICSFFVGSMKEIQGFRLYRRYWKLREYDLQWLHYKGYPYLAPKSGDPAELKTEMPKDVDWISALPNPGLQFSSMFGSVTLSQGPDLQKILR